MKDIFILEGKKYISSRRASEISDYASDYIGQLCRAEKLDCRMIGRTWFVTEESLRVHKMQVADSEIVRNRIENIRGKKGKPSKLSTLIAEKIANAHSSISGNIGSSLLKAHGSSVATTGYVGSETSTSTSITPSFIYKDDNRPLLPVLNKESDSVVSDQIQTPVLETSASISTSISNSTPTSTKTSTETTISIVSEISRDVSYAKLTRSIILGRALKVTAGALGLVLVFSIATFDFNSSNSSNISGNTASVSSVFSSVSSFFARMFGGSSRKVEVAFNTPNTSNLSRNSDQIASSSPMGVAVVGSSGSNAQDEATKRKIADSFSDNVEVKADKSGTAGVIKPVFKQTNGEDFIYVLVPVNKAKSP